MLQLQSYRLQTLFVTGYRHLLLAVLTGGNMKALVFRRKDEQ
jgi:hypothetical protein